MRETVGAPWWGCVVTVFLEPPYALGRELVELKTVWGAAEEQGYPYGTILQLLIAMGQRRGGGPPTSAGPGLTRPSGPSPCPTRSPKIIRSIPSRTGISSPAFWRPYRAATRLASCSPPKYPRNDPSPAGASSKPILATVCLVGPCTTCAVLSEPPTRKPVRRSEIGERLINHAAAVQTVVESIYDVYHYMPQMRDAAIKFEDHLQSLLARAA